MKNPLIPDTLGEAMRKAIFRPTPPIPPIFPGCERVAKMLRAPNRNSEIILKLVKANCQ